MLLRDSLETVLEKPEMAGIALQSTPSFIICKKKRHQLIRKVLFRITFVIVFPSEHEI